MVIKGTFDIKSVPEPPYASAGGVILGRVSITKQFHGELQAQSTVDMIAARTPVQGSAGYVAIELVSGALAGKEGTFVLQHSGTMNRGAPELSVTVVPDSGTEALQGLRGRMTIDIVDGKHFYTFDYELEG